MKAAPVLSMARARARRPAGWSDPFRLAGVAALVASSILTLFAPPTIVPFALGAVAVAGLARDRRLGVLPAALLVMIAIPYGRAADNNLAEIAGIPLRFQDGALGAAVLLSLPAIRAFDLRPGHVRAAVLWLGVGVVAILIGLLDQPVRDIARDLRWWVLYGAIAIAAWSGVRREAVIRAVVVGAVLFTVLLFAAALLPPFDGGLKDRALTYDRGLLRLQFSNAVFVIVACTWLLNRLLLRPTLRHALGFGFLAAGVLLSLTRVSILVLVAVVVLSLVVTIGRRQLRPRIEPVRAPTRVPTWLFLIGVPLVIAGGALVAVAAGAGDASSPFERLLFQAPNSDLDAIARGRGQTYEAALRLVAERPILGHGMGALIEFEFTPGGSRPATPGMQPGVDNAYQTVAVKAGLLGVVAFVILIGWPLVELARRPRERHRVWFSIAWLGVLAMTVTQSFATTGYGPFGLALLIAFLPLRRLPPRVAEIPP